MATTKPEWSVENIEPMRLEGEPKQPGKEAVSKQEDDLVDL
jgi:hypothetical protein